MSTTAVAVNEEVLKSEALTIVEQAKIVRIIDQPSYESACSLLLDQIKPLRKRWAEYWDQPKTMAYQAYKSILGKFQEGDEPLAKAEAQVKGAIGVWDAEQERKRQELQRQAEKEAREQEERARLTAAEMAEESGATNEEVEAIVNTPVAVIAKPVEPTYQKASGVSTRENWSARVTDIKALCLAVAKGKAPVSYVEANMTALNARARADRGTLAVPGVVAVNNPIVSGRTK
jgi:hypothetical protein